MKYLKHLFIFFVVSLMVPAADADGPSRRFVPGEVIVKLRTPSSSGVSSKVHEASFFSKVNGLRGDLVHKGKFAGLHMHQFKTADESADIDQLVADLSTLDEVEYAEPNYLIEKQSVETASRVYTQQDLQAFSGLTLTSANIQATAAWTQVTTPGGPVVVAIIDTGIDYTHPALSNAIWVNPNEIGGNQIDDDHNGYIDDVRGWNFAYNTNNPMDGDGHGTHVSGIVLGTTQDLFANPAPANPSIRLMPVKFLDDSGSGSTSSAIAAIYYAVNNGARVLNNSWGGGGYSRALEEAIAYAYSKDALFVAAAGNSGTNNDADPMYPASYQVPNVISVAATTDSDLLASFSNFGASSVHLSAPGVAIFSAYPGAAYAYLSGTSMATPFVSGITALMRHESPTMNAYQVKDLLLGKTDSVASLRTKTVTGGRVNSLNSVFAAKTAVVSSDQPAYSLTPNVADRSLAGAISNRGGTGCGSVQLVHKLGAKGNFPDSFQGVFVSLVLLMVPFFILIAIRQKPKTIHPRKFERFQVSSQVTFKVGGQEFVGAVKTMSMGGSDLNTDQLLQDGSILTMVISSPDGSQHVQVQGQVVWSQANKRYGIEFKGISEAVRGQIAAWTAGLAKAS